MIFIIKTKFNVKLKKIKYLVYINLYCYSLSYYLLPGFSSLSIFSPQVFHIISHYLGFIIYF
uniref:Putative ovule protein n=1 Tax=Solanum chacoense TaxID=4108 RepID=A0A0V0GPI2_SOLCH